MSNQTLDEIFARAFQNNPRNGSYAIPGLYDLKLEDATVILTITIVVFTMRTGWALLHSGIITTKNEVNMMIRNMIDVCIGGMAFWFFGYAFMFGRGELTKPYIALGDFFVEAKVEDPLLAQIFTSYFFRMSFASVAVTIVSGAVAERFNTHAYIIFAFVHTAVYAIGAGWVYGEHGFLKNLGVVDFSGSGPIHIIGGASALCATIFIGPRTGRYEKGIRPLRMGNPMNACTGLFILWWGWLGYNTASSYGVTGGKWDFAARAGLGTTIASFSTGSFVMLYSLWRHKGKVDVLETLMGIIASMVAINAGCVIFPTYISIIVGILSAFFASHASIMFDKLHIDDPVGACSAHLIGGIWGEISVGLFAQNPFPMASATGRTGLFMGGGGYMLAAQAFSVVCLFLWGVVSTLVILWILNKIIPVRLSLEDEAIGCDIIYHFGNDHDELMQPLESGREMVTPRRISLNTFTVPQANFSISTSLYQKNGSYKEFDSPRNLPTYHNKVAFRGDSFSESDHRPS